MRESGILFHITSLPNQYGIGSLGKEAYQFVDFLKRCCQSYWQVLPIGPTSYGDSPYQTFSVFAGNPYFIDLDLLVENGLLTKSDLSEYIVTDSEYVDFEKIYKTRFIILRKAYSNFIINDDFINFKDKNRFWLDDFALFMAIKFKSIEGNWLGWDISYQRRYREAINEFIKCNLDDLEFWKFTQYLFFQQWFALKKYANENGIKIIGDMPIYVAFDSSDVWADPKSWLLDEELKPTLVAGVPPDYFAKTGQLWGNPIYDYDYMKKNGYSWWVKRIEESFKLFDVVRIDHFRGFESFYAVPAKDKTAEYGSWMKGPGMDLFDKIKENLGDLDIIAEDLGFLTPEVKKLLKDSGYPGMKILQFGFNPDDDSDHMPHNYTANTICYTGTHDNMTLKEWLSSLKPNELRFVYDYIGIKDDEDAIKEIIKCLFATVSNRVIIPLRDYLELGKEGRFNIPSTLGGNWIWRLQDGQISTELEEEITFITKLYKRCKKVN